ncbi:MAG: glycosyl hydrolase family 28-related protein [Verrucomicrobiales bacterium]
MQDQQPLHSILILSLFFYVSGIAADLPITFPADGGILDVREYGAIAGDDGDDTKAIQAALDAFPDGNRIVYLPAGVFIVRDTLRWPAGENGSVAQRRTILQGAGEALTLLKLPESTGGFTDGGKPKAVVWTGNTPAQRFRNAVRDLTLDIGPRNHGAIGLQFNASNQGSIRNLTIRSLDGSGRIGLDLGHSDEIGPLLARHITVDGFEVGISTKWPVNSITFEHVLLRNQRRLGWWNYHQMVFVRDLISENRVPSIYNEKDSWGTVTLLDAHLHAINPDGDTPGILNQRQMYLRNVEILGYRVAIDHDDKDRDKGDINPPGLVNEETSHKNVRSLWREIGDGTFAQAGEVSHLPVKETPEVPRGDPAKDWVNLLTFGANFLFSSTVEIRGPVQRIIGLEGQFTAAAATAGGDPLWKLVDGKHPQNLPDAPTVVIERMSGVSGGHSIRIRHESKRTLVVSSTTGLDVEGYGKGDLFLDDFCGNLNRVAPGQSAWCRQLNSEREGVKCRNAGGKLWILGLKTEKTGTLVETTAGGITEINGVFLYSNSGWTSGEPAFLVEDSTLNLFGVNERNFNRQPVSLWVRERRGDETRELAELPWVYLGR